MTHTKLGIPDLAQDWSLQEIFDLTVAHLWTQGAPSWIDDGTVTGACLYRSEIGSCALGYWIDDNLYDSNIENCTVEGLVDAMSYIRDMDDGDGGLLAAQALDRLADGTLEGLENWVNNVIDSGLRLVKFLEDDKRTSLLTRLQDAHDSWSDGVEEMIQRLHTTAAIHGLDTAVLTATFGDFCEHAYT